MFVGPLIIQKDIQQQTGVKPLIKDETDKNLEYGINANEIIQKGFDNAKKLQEEQWAREDEIRKHVEEREDSAWTRSVRDMINAGINPNLVNASPAASGGGITNATGMDYTLYEKEFDKNLELLMQEIEQNFKGEQADKDRVLKLIQSIITVGGLLAVKK